MFGTHRIKFDPKLLERARTCAQRVGYSSVEEFITHAVERAVAAIEEAPDEQELKRRLKGLGYL